MDWPRARERLPPRDPFESRRAARDSPGSSTAAPGHPERADSRRIARRALLQVVADVPHRAIVGWIDRRRRVILPPERGRLRRFAFHEYGLLEREDARGIGALAPGEPLSREMRRAAERVADADVAEAIDRRTRHPPVEPVG